MWSIAESCYPSHSMKYNISFLCMITLSHFKQPGKQKVAKKFPENCQKVITQFHCAMMHQAINQKGPEGFVILIF